MSAVAGPCVRFWVRSPRRGEGRKYEIFSCEVREDFRCPGRARGNGRDFAGANGKFVSERSEFLIACEIQGSGRVLDRFIARLERSVDD